MKTRKKVLIGAGNQELQVSSSPAQARGISDKGYSDANLSTAKGYTDSEIQKLDSSASPASGNNVLTGITITNGKITGSTSASAALTSGNQTIAGNKTFSGDTTLSGLVTAGKTNFISSSNEFNFIPAGFDNVVHINYRSASGSAVAVSSYYFDNGDSSGGLADLYAKKGVFTSLQCSTAPSSSIDVVRKLELDAVKSDYQLRLLREFLSGGLPYSNYASQTFDSSYKYRHALIVGQVYCRAGGINKYTNAICIGMQLFAGETSIANVVMPDGTTQAFTCAVNDQGSGIIVTISGPSDKAGGGGFNYELVKAGLIIFS